MSNTITLLELLFKHKPQAQQILIWSKETKESFYFADYTQAQHKAEQIAKKADSYFGVCTISSEFAKNPTNKKRRATMNEVVGCPALFADVDYGDSHAKKNIPPTERDAISLVMRMPAEPSIIVSSGNGLHVYWLLKEFELFTSDDKREQLQKLNEDWQRKMQALARDFDWTVDSTFNLDRILRVSNTLNHKQQPTKEVKILEYNDKSYSIGDLKDYVLGVKADSPSRRYRSGGVKVDGSLVLDEKASYDSAKFDALSQEEPRFKQSYDRTRKGMKDSSPSAYDLSLATFAYHAGWTDQEIVNLLISSRRFHKDDLKLRDDYYQRTLQRAKSETQNKIHNVKVIEAANAEVSNDKHENLKNVSDALNIEIVRIVKFNGDKPTYIFYFAGGHEISITSGAWADNQKILSQAIFEKLDVKVNPFKANEWKAIVDKITESMEKIEADESNQELSVLNSILAHYLTEKYNDKDDTESHSNRLFDYQPALHGEVIYFNLEEFIRYLKYRYDETKKRSELSVLLKRLGSETKSISVRANRGGQSKVTKRYVWSIPVKTLEMYKELGGYEVSTDVE